MVTMAFVVILTVCVALLWPIQRYQSAPGRAFDVVSRLRISGTDRPLYEPATGIRFVTALGSGLTPLQAFMAWVDPYVDVLTCEERFGECDPERARQIQLGVMATAKEIAEYAAMTYLGIPAELIEGPAQVAGFDADLCPSNAPAQRACRLLEVGDVITSVDIGTGPVAIEKVSQLSEVLAEARPGDNAELSVVSITEPTKRRTVVVELLASPDDPQRALIGFNPRDTRTVSLPFDVEIDTESIRGPSAGLSFALALIDVLTPGDLGPTAGVAATGTLDAAGNVGPIGSLVQKVIAVKQSGLHYLVVPLAQGEDEIEKARRAGGAEVEVIAVATLDEAVQAVAELSGVEPPSRANPATRT